MTGGPKSAYSALGGDALPLLVWLSPAFPVGAFAYSHGVESAVETGDIHDAATLRDWLGDLLARGAGRNDAVILAEAWRAARRCDVDALVEVNALALALSPSRERLLETRAQGDAFLAAIIAAWPCGVVEAFAGRARNGVAYPVALGVAAAGWTIPLSATLEAMLIAYVSNLVSAAVRLGPIGQTDGQRVIAGLAPVVSSEAAFAARSTLDDLGGCAVRSDVASMRHETQYSRLFRS